MQPSPYSTEEAANFPGLGDPTLKAEYGRPDRQWENHGEGQGPLRQYNPRPFLDRKMGSADLQTPAPWYTPFDWTGGHWHRWHTRKVDQTGIAIPKEFDEREVKKNDFWAESALSKWASYLVEGSAWDDEWYVERTPQGFWADFFDPAWESMLRSAKIFNDEDMPQWWQNRFRAMGFYIPLIFWFSRRLMRKIWRFETQLTLRTDGRRNESFARRFRYGLGIKRRRKLGPKKRRRIGALTWRRIITGALLFLPVPFFVEQLRRDTTPFAYAVAFGAVGAMFGPRNTMSMVACASVGWFWGAGKEFVQRFEGATMSYLQRTEPIKNDYVRLKVDKLREKLPAKAVADLRLNRVTWLDEHKRDAIGHPWASVKSGHWEDPVDDPRELDLYPDYPWFRPALWRPYMWYIRPYEPVVPDPRRPFNPEDEEAFKAAHVPQAMANIVDRESLQYWMKLREELGFAERDLPDDQGNDDDEYEDEWELEDEGPGVALEMEQDEEVEPALSAPPGIHKDLDANAKMLMRDMLHADVYDWSPVSDSPGWDPEAFMPVDLDDPRLATPELSEQDYANEDYDAFGPDVFADEDE